MYTTSNATYRMEKKEKKMKPIEIEHENHDPCTGGISFALSRAQSYEL